MSDRYPGGIIVANPTAPTTTSAPGIWTLEQASYYIGQGTWPLQPVPDPYYEYVTMLLPGNGTNGAQNNTFLDSSTNAFSITRNGNTTQGSFSPYGSLWSNYFNGSNTYLSPPANTAFAFGTNAFTIEGWFYSNSSSASQSIADNYNGEGAGSDGTVGIVALYAGNIRFTSINSVYLSYAYTANQWNHFAIVRSGTTLSLFLNGSRVATTTNSSNFTSTTSYKIGAEYNSSTYSNFFSGNLSNIRLVKGTAVYDPSLTTITVPTTSLTAVSGTSLLTCQSNRFIDNSSNSFALTVGGTPSVQRFSPFNPTASYSTATIGGSGYFDGSGDWLTASGSSNFQCVTASSATIDFWYYPTTSGSIVHFCGSYPGAGTGNWLFYAEDGLTPKFYEYPDVGGTLVSSTPATLNAWNHIALVKTSTTGYIYLNGVRTGSLTANFQLFNSSNNTFYVGSAWSDRAPIKGYMSDFRYVNGTALYTNSTYTVPTSPSTAVANTQLLCNFTNAGIPDSAMMNDLETVGNAQVSTSVKKFGTGSIYLDGTSDCLNVYAPVVKNYGTGDFTWEGWFYFNNVTNEAKVYDGRTTGATSFMVYIQSGTLRFFYNGSDRITSSSLSTSTWYHIAIVRNSGVTKMYLDGTQTGSSYTDANNYTAGDGKLYLFATDASGSQCVNGYIDDFRITNGYARYTANFTPPTAAFPTF